MHEVDRDWIGKQMGKAISAEQAMLDAEKEHLDRVRKEVSIASVYERLVRDDEKHLDELKRVADRYGHESEGIMSGAGGILGSLKSAVEGLGAADPFQAIGDDLMMKSNALNYDQAWAKIFRDIGDSESAHALELAAQEDEEHEALMRQTLTNVGLRQAYGERIEEE